MIFRLRLFTVILALSMFALGCGSAPDDAPQTYDVSGSVTFDGEPVKEGDMIFSDPAGQDRSYGAKIVAGQFSTKMTAGKKTVKITATRESKDKTAPGPSGEPAVPVLEQYIPVQYNEQTTLEVEVKADASNELEFDLKPQ